ncbi:MAG: hypothetical protein IPO64_02670 [Bacteroidetes bacterium]|nr:hypothetical protein [Bacteroidota bacterium]
MKKSFTLIVLILLFGIKAFAQPSKGSISVGYGTHKFVVRGDYNLTENLIKVENSSTRLYLDIGYDWKKFENDDFIFNSNTYSSNVIIFNVGLGVGQEFIFKDKFIVQPYVGILYKYARMADKDLVEAIGTYNLIRRAYIGGPQVGKVVDNAYGNLVTIDLGSRFGFRIKKKFEIGGSFGICPAKFSTSNTLFGKYWGEKPYNNDYYIKRFILKAEANFKYNF